MMRLLLLAVPLVQYHIEAGPAAQAILRWSQQSHYQVMWLSRVLAPLRAQPLSGAHEPVEGLRRMLRYTRLKVTRVNDHTVAVQEDAEYCHPEWGADAPLPPCQPLPLTIRPGDEL